MNKMVSVMATDEEIKAFDKEQLKILLSDLKDIHKFTGFKDGTFKYELGKYQANILIDYIEELQQRIDKALDKLYCWGEILDAEFQQEMIRILKEEPNNE